MTEVPTLLDDDGAASIATAVMMSHHGFRRDIRRFGLALEALAGGGGAHLAALRDEWRSLRATLHGHHHAEDTGIFPIWRASTRRCARRSSDWRRTIAVSIPCWSEATAPSPISPGRARPPLG